MVLGSVYAPPPLSWTLAERLLTLWEEIPLGVTVVGGDWNDVMDPGRDRWRQGGLPASDRPTKLSALVEGLGWLDAWRALHGPEQHYTYFSATHASFLRLDYIFVPRGLLNRMRDVEILPRGFSDHSPVALILQLGPERPPFDGAFLLGTFKTSNIENILIWHLINSCDLTLVQLAQRSHSGKL